MFDPGLFAAFLLAATVLTITPGVDTATVLRSAAADGSGSGVWAGAGIAVGCLVWSAAVSLGLGAILHASELAYTIVKWAGAGYLMWIGATMLWRPCESLDTTVVVRAAGPAAFRRGLFTNLLNPKIGVFYVTFLPQFVPPGVNVAAYSFFLAVIHVALSILWFAILIAATVPLSHWLQTPAVVKTLDRVTGGIFIAFGLKLGLSRA